MVLCPLWLFFVVGAVLQCRALESNESSMKNNLNNETIPCGNYDTFEKQFHCGEDGYFLKFGKHYCLRFFDPEIFKDFDDAGKQFVRCTGPCLVDSLRDFLKANPSASCPAIADAAFETHVGCYSRCGFCGACQHNLMTLRKVFSLKDFLSGQVLKAIQGVTKGCGGAFKTAISCIFG